MYKVEIMMRYEKNHPAKNTLYSRVTEYSFDENGFLNLSYEANGKIYNRGIAVQNIITYTVSRNKPSEETRDDSADN